MDTITVEDNPERSRFEARTPDGQVVGFIDYRPAQYTGEDSSAADLEMADGFVSQMGANASLIRGPSISLTRRLPSLGKA